MQNSNMIISIFTFYYQKKGIPSENPFLFRKELYIKKRSLNIFHCQFDLVPSLSKYSPLSDIQSSDLPIEGTFIFFCRCTIKTLEYFTKPGCLR